MKVENVIIQYLKENHFYVMDQTDNEKLNRKYVLRYGSDKYLVKFFKNGEFNPQSSRKNSISCKIDAIMRKADLPGYQMSNYRSILIIDVVTDPCIDDPSHSVKSIQPDIVYRVLDSDCINSWDVEALLPRFMISDIYNRKLFVEPSMTRSLIDKSPGKMSAYHLRNF